MFGYQGWFLANGDGSPIDGPEDGNGWHHWFRDQTPDADHANFDLFPDLSEFDADELFLTDMTYGDGSPVRVFSSITEKTVVRHFEWMKDAGMDGVFLQRFLGEARPGNPTFRQVRDIVTNNVRIGAETHGRAFAMMYDLSGSPTETLVPDLIDDWKHLIDDLQITQSDRYMRHAGRPVLAIWGFGFKDRGDTPTMAGEIIDFLHNTEEDEYRATVMWGVPTYWRTQPDDSDTEPLVTEDWGPAYYSMDIISPWLVGRFGDEAGADSFRTNLIEPDMADLAPRGIEYMPVLFPGFSWTNLRQHAVDAPLNQIPRNGGEFYWRQVYNSIDAGATMLYGAMFDEVDEATAFMKAAPSSSDLPQQGTFLSLDADGQSLPSDWYLQLAGAATETLRGERALSEGIPITP
jgi:hypothetical protein